MPTHLPGVIRTLDLAPAPCLPAGLRDTRALHGVLSHVWDVPHHGGRAPNFALLPWPVGIGWAAQWLCPGAESLPSSLPVHVFNAQRELRLGPPMRVKYPKQPTTPGPHRVELRTLTPVVIRTEGVCRPHPDTRVLRGALCSSPLLQQSLGESVHADEVDVQVLDVRTQPVEVRVGGKWGTAGMVSGWEGRVLLSCNAYARYLLSMVELVGMGGRTSLGFGRVRLREVGR